jgi:hypothetical protein
VEAGNLASKHLLDGAVARGLQVGGPLHPILDRSLPTPGQKPRHLTAARARDQSSLLTSDIFLLVVVRLSANGGWSLQNMTNLTLPSHQAVAINLAKQNPCSLPYLYVSSRCEALCLNVRRAGALRSLRA